MCDDPSLAPKAAIVGLWAAGNDLEAKLATDPALGQVTVVLRLDESIILASTTVPVSADGLASIVMPGVLAGAESREIRYHLEATDVLGTPLMEPYPFLLLFDCLGGCQSDCFYHLIPGVMTEALVVTERLSMALESLPECNLLPNLLNLSSSGDCELSLAAQTLIHQLKLRDLDQLPPNGCRNAWQTVIPIGLDFWTITDTTTQSADGSHTLSQTVGWESGAAACYRMQGTGLQGEPKAGAFPVSSQGELHTSATQVEQSIICLQGAKSCVEPCKGQVDVYLDFDRCLKTESRACNLQSTATATALHVLNYQINDHVMLDQNRLESEVLACGYAGCDSDWPMHYVTEFKDDLDAQAQTPAVVSLTGETRITYSSDSREQDGATYSFVQSDFDYRLKLIGSGSSCTERELVGTWIKAPTIVQGDDGIKMRRWWPDGESSASGARGSIPPLPEICQTSSDQ